MNRPSPRSNPRQSQMVVMKKIMKKNQTRSLKHQRVKRDHQHPLYTVMGRVGRVEYIVLTLLPMGRVARVECIAAHPL